MWKKILITVVLIFIILIISFLDKKILKQKVEAPVISEETSKNFIEPLILKHQYKDGKHIFVGNIDLPNPCYKYKISILDTENLNRKKINIDLIETEQNCVNVIKPVTFKISYKGKPDLQFQFFVNGNERKLNIFEIPKDIDIDSFKLNLKG